MTRVLYWHRAFFDFLRARQDEHERQRTLEAEITQAVEKFKQLRDR